MRWLSSDRQVFNLHSTDRKWPISMYLGYTVWKLHTRLSPSQPVHIGLAHWQANEESWFCCFCTAVPGTPANREAVCIVCMWPWVHTATLWPSDGWFLWDPKELAFRNSFGPRETMSWKAQGLVQLGFLQQIWKELPVRKHTSIHFFWWPEWHRERKAV